MALALAQRGHDVAIHYHGSAEAAQDTAAAARAFGVRAEIFAADLLDESGTYGSKRKEILDSVSATVILDDYLAWRKDHPGEI